MLALFIKGFLIGLSIAAPVGPIGILCINRTLASGLRAGLLSGVGAAVADAVYGCIAGFGLVSLSQFLIAQEIWIRLLGGAFLLYLGVKIFLSSGPVKQTNDQANTLFQDFYSTFFLTLMNPATIISFIAIFASLGIVEVNTNYTEASTIVLGVFLGSLLWWCILSIGIASIHHKLNTVVLKWINYFSGVILVSFGLLAILSGALKQ